MSDSSGLGVRGSDAAALRTSTESLRSIIAARLRYRDDTVTVSIGAATLASGETVSAWLARADAAMYRAKNDARNWVVVDEGPGRQPETCKAIADRL